jgi:Flp pilus assembly protein TadG
MLHHDCCVKQRQSGHSAVEVALMLPWLVFSFMGTLNLGMASYALVSLENAARVAATYTASSATVAQTVAANPSASTACGYALDELRYAPFVGTGVSTCTASDPVQLAATYNSTGSDKQNPSATVSVTYTIHLLAIPAIMPSSLTITRKVELPLRS